MTQNINFFFNEFSQNEIYNYISSKDLNISVNATFFNKISVEKFKFKSILSEFSNKEIKNFQKKKRKYDFYLRTKSIHKIKNKILHKEFIHPLERLFMNGNSSIYDVIFYLFSIRKKNVKKIKIFFGQNYSIPEIYSFYFWCISIKSFFNCKFEFFFLKRGEKIKISKDFNDFFIKNIIATYKVPNVDFEILSNNKINLVWLEGLKYKVDFNKTKYVVKNSECVYIGFSKDRYDNAITFGENISLEEFNNLQHNYEKKLKKKIIKIKNQKKFNNNFALDLLENFFINYIELFIDRFKKVENNYDKIFKGKKIIKFICPCSPYFESISLASWCKKNKIEINLFPHSSTSSHEFHPNTYEKNYTTIRSNDIVTSIDWNIKNYKKEILIKKKDIQKSTIKLKTSYIFKKLLSFRVSQLIELTYLKLFNSIFNYIQKILLYFRLKKIDKTTIKIGLILNCSSIYFVTEADFIRIYNSISSLIKQLSKKKIILFIKFKPYYENKKIFKKILLKNNGSRVFENVFICQDEFSISNLSKMIDVGVCYSGTSGIIEVIENNIPILKIRDPSVNYINSPYINLKSVPSFYLNKIIDKICDKEYLRSLAKKQFKFLKKRMLK